MGKERPFLATMNGGEVSPLALARVDLARMRYTGETMLNIFPRVIGSMQIRPGFKFLASTHNDAVAKQIPFIFAADDVAMVELTDLRLEVQIDGAPITRGSVATVVTNGDFSSGVGWTLTTSGGGTSVVSGGKLTMNCTVRGGKALAKRSVTVAGADQGDEHALRIVVDRGPVRLRVGTSDGTDNYINETLLNTGTYSMAFTPTGNFFVQLSCDQERNVIVDEITIEAAGVMSIATPWTAAVLNQCRYDQSGDVIFVANTSREYQTRRIERRHDARSWGVALHENKDGPWRGKTADVGLTPTIVATTNVGTLASDAPFFKSDHVGCLFHLYHPTTRVTQSISAEDKYTDVVRCNGRTAAERQVTYTVSGTWSGTVTFQVSYDEEETWSTLTSRTNNGSASLSPGDSNQVTHLRAGFLPGEHTSGTAVISLVYEGGGGFGVVRVTGFTSSILVSIEKLTQVHRDGVKSNEWEEGQFSDLNGWPSSLGFFDGRLWLGDRDKINGSVSDDFNSLDVEVDGDSGPIIRSIATGAVNRALSILGLSRLLIFTTGAESAGRSSSFDEPMTPTNFSIKDASTQGSADIAAVKLDRSGVYVQRSGRRLYVVRYDVEAQDYVSSELTRYHPTILFEGVVGMAIQRQPDTRIWLWLEDGTAGVLVYEPQEDVISWCRVETDGIIEDMAVLPNADADDVFAIVKRTIMGVDKRYRERLAYDTQAQSGGDENFVSDSYWTATLAATSTMTGGLHLAGETVVLWIDGSPILDASGDPATFAVDSLGQVALGSVYSGFAVAGLYYEGTWKSTKLAYGAQMGTAVTQPKQVRDLGLVMYKTHLRSIKYGKGFDKLFYLPRTFNGRENPFDTFMEDYDARPVPVPGDWSTDSRICILMRAPMPCTVLGLAGAVETHERP